MSRNNRALSRHRAGAATTRQFHKSRHAAAVVLLGLSLAFSPASIAAQGTTAVAVKAAFLYNFAKFAEWPAAALQPRQQMAVCVVGDSAIAAAIQQAVNGNSVDDHDLVVRVMKPDAVLNSCHLLYVDGVDIKRAREILAGVKGAAVLTVGESEGFAAAGGVAELIQGRDRIRFAINVASARRAGLKMSAKLLSLATIVKDDHDEP
jgi:uncharacterized protein DUF4154